MNKLEITYVDPNELHENPWNPNKVSPGNMEKLKHSLIELDEFKPILVRTLPDGRLEILGGAHRRLTALALGQTEIPVINLGVIDDAKAKKIGLVDNGRYGEDDTKLLSELLEGLGTAEELIALLPIDEEELASYFKVTEVNFDDLNLEPDVPGIDPDLDLSGPQVQTHQILRFKVSKVDAPAVIDLIDRIKREQSFIDADDLTNSGDALVHLVRTYGTDMPAEPEADDEALQAMLDQLDADLP